MNHQVVVIGAGPGGLATAAELRRAGLDALVIDRADSLGAAWRTRYDRLKLNTTRWISKLPRAPYAKGTPMYPTRDEFVAYLERFAADNQVRLKLRTTVQRIDRVAGGWRLQTSAGGLTASQVVIATGLQNVPKIPQWPGRDRFAGPFLHAAEYRNAEPHRFKNVLVIGPGSSGMEIAFDLLQGGARSVQVAVRTKPNIMLRETSFPADLPPLLLFKLPPRLADAVVKIVRRLEIGDLSAYGLPWPKEGIFTRLRRDGKVPAILDHEVIEAIRARKIRIVAGVESFDERGVRLLDGTRLAVDAVIAATGYGCGLQSLVGHLDVLSDRGVPRRHDAAAAAPGLRFVGYQPVPGQIGAMGRQAKRVARAIGRELHATRVRRHPPLKRIYSRELRS